MSRVLKIKVFAGTILIFISTVIVLFLKEDNSNISIKLEPSPSYRQKIKGTEAKIVIYEFSDFSCPACEKMHFYLKDLIDYFPYIRVDFKHYPLTNLHPNAMKAAIWAECAGKEYGKFWEFADLLFSTRDKWSNSTDSTKYFEEFSKKISLDLYVMKNCVSSSNAIDLVKKDMNEGDRIGVDSTPTFFLNGKKAIGGHQLVERLKEVIK
ncbi:MAG: DsbA family protein [Elusimicrobiales bacterium]